MADRLSPYDEALLEGRLREADLKRDDVPVSDGFRNPDAGGGDEVFVDAVGVAPAGGAAEGGGVSGTKVLEVLEDVRDPARVEVRVADDVRI